MRGDFGMLYLVSALSEQNSLVIRKAHVHRKRGRVATLRSHERVLAFSSGKEH